MDRPYRPLAAAASSGGGKDSALNLLRPLRWRRKARPMERGRRPGHLPQRGRPEGVPRHFSCQVGGVARVVMGG
jgi:hypothetical protein